MEKLFSSLAAKIINILDKNNNCTQIERLQMHYGVQTLIYNISTISFIIIAAYIAGTFVEAFLLFLLFGLLRFFVGGYHCNHMESCIFLTSFLILGGSKFAQCVQIPFPICTLLFIIMNSFFYNFLPKGTRKNPFTPKYSKIQQKRLRIIVPLLTLTAFYTDTVLFTIILLSMAYTVILLIQEVYHK